MGAVGVLVYRDMAIPFLNLILFSSRGAIDKWVLDGWLRRYHGGLYLASSWHQGKGIRN